MTRALSWIWCAPLLLASATRSLPAFAVDEHGHASPAASQPSSAELSSYVPGQQRLEGELIAPCCWTQTLDVHNSPLVSQLKSEIRQRLTAGESIDQVRASMVARYGSKVLAVQPKSPLRGFAIGLSVLLVLGGVGAAFTLRKWKARSEKSAEDAKNAPPEATSAATNAELDERLERELGQFEG